MERISMSAVWTDKLREEIQLRSREPYTITFGMEGADFKSFRDAVNQGIDSHLEAVRFEEYRAGRQFTVSADTVHVLVRRLMEADDTNSNSLGAGICETLGIELI